MKNLQKGDVYKTHASINKIKNEYKYKPKYNIEEGISKFLDWYFEYNKQYLNFIFFIIKNKKTNV